MKELRIVVAGAGGRMGQALVREVAAQDDTRLVGAIDQNGADVIGRDCGDLAGIGENGIEITADPLPVLAATDVLLDFTAPAATVQYSELTAQARLVHVIGTTGLSFADEERLRAAARHARIIKAGNMSLGVNLLAALVRRAAAALGTDYDVEVLEMHHRHKVDAPSGTALLLAQAAAEGRNAKLQEVSVRARDGHAGARKSGTIGFASLRGGSVVGDHTVIMAGQGERIEFTHRAEDRKIFARGAVRAAQWGFDKKPGLYSMADVLGLH